MPRNVAEKIKVAFLTVTLGLMALVGCASCLLVMGGCGGGDAVVVNRGGGAPKAFTFADAQKDCGGCHGGDAFMQSEAAFKGYAPNLGQVKGGKMPKGAPYDDAKRKLFETFFNTK